PCGVRVLGIRGAIVAEREPLPPAEGAEVVVEGVVLHHQDDDVLDLRQHVGASRTGGIGSVARPVPAYPPLPPAQFLAFDPLPGAHAGHISSFSAACFAPGYSGRPPTRSYPPIHLPNSCRSWSSAFARLLPR